MRLQEIKEIDLPIMFDLVRRCLERGEVVKFDSEGLTGQVVSLGLLKGQMYMSYLAYSGDVLGTYVEGTYPKEDEMEHAALQKMDGYWLFTLPDNENIKG